MFNIFEQPWLLFAVAFLVLIIIYITTLERKFYWLSLLLLISLAVLNLLLKLKLSFLGPNIINVLKYLLPVAAAGLSIWLIISIIQLDDRSSYIWFLPLVLIIAGFGLDWLVKTDSEKISLAINKCRQAVRQQDVELLDSIISEQYQDSYHSSKQALLQHFRNYFSQPLCDSITKTYMQTDKKDGQAVVTAAFFLTFNPKSFPAKDYGVLNATVAVRIKLKKEKDKQWRIYETEITEVNNQPFSWSAVGR